MVAREVDGGVVHRAWVIYAKIEAERGPVHDSSHGGMVLAAFSE